MIGPIPGIDAERGDWEREEQLARRWDREEAARGEGIRWGLQPEQSPISLIPDTIRPGQRVSAFTLTRIAEDYGDAAARALDAELYPCPCCGVAFYSPDGWGLCDRCELDESEAADRFTVTINEAALEAAGTFSPREG